MENTNDKGRNAKKEWQKPECVELDVQETEEDIGPNSDAMANESS